MKKFLLLALAAGLALPVASFAQGTLKIGMVDMDRALKEYNKTKEALSKVNDAKNAAKKEFDDRTDGYKKALDEINKLTQQLEAPALSADAKNQKAKERDEKVANIKAMEREITEFRQSREQQLQQQVSRMRESIVKEITDQVLERVKTNGMDLVLDKSGVGMQGVPFILYSKDTADFTTEIITALNKKAATSAPATSPPSPATAPAKPAASPAKPPTKP
jgi:Skp family chaperone for outer membrane proteins